MAHFFINLAEKGMLHDTMLRMAMRHLLRERLKQETETQLSLEEFIRRMSEFPVAVHADEANEQHYEVPAAFFRQVLGPQLKYSSAYWPEDTVTLDEAENRMLELTCERAQLENGQDILELGCGWGSLSLWMAGHYPDSRVLAVSNSASQRAYIEEQCRLRHLTNVEVQTCDMNNFSTSRQFDRVISIEMFEHMRNHRELMARISGWLKDGGKLFVHVFSHRSLRYLFETDGAQNWMGRYFFTGGMMPSHDLLPAYQDDLKLESDWFINGTHYSRTLEAWLEKQDADRQDVMRVFNAVYGEKEARRWFQRWRMFFMACSELFAYNGGNEWGVSHYRFRKNS